MKLLSIGLVMALGAAGCQKQTPAKPVSASELVSMPYHWDYAYSSVFSDGGSLAYGFINNEGLIVYLTALSPMRAPEKRVLRLQRSFNDKDATVLIRGSKLEADVLKLVENANEYPWMKAHMPSLDRLKAMLLDRSAPFPSDSSESGAPPSP
jgi:hypothetical protein